MLSLNACRPDPYACQRKASPSALDNLVCPQDPSASKPVRKKDMMVYDNEEAFVTLRSLFVPHRNCCICPPVATDILVLKSFVKAIKIILHSFYAEIYRRKMSPEKDDFSKAIIFKRIQVTG